MCRCGTGYCVCSGTTYTEGFLDGLSVGYALGYEHGYAHGVRAGYAQNPYARERAERERLANAQNAWRNVLSKHDRVLSPKGE